MNKFMSAAIEEAKISGADVPVRAVVVKAGKILSQAHNQREINFDVSAHAEICALKQAGENLQNWRLDECEIYVPLEPCPMCAWAIIQSRIKTVYFGSFDIQSGAFGSACDLKSLAANDIKIYSGIEEETCDNIIRDFWKKKRENDG